MLDNTVPLSVGVGLRLPTRSVTESEVVDSKVVLLVAFATPIELVDALILPFELESMIPTVLVDM